MGFLLLRFLVALAVSVGAGRSHPSVQMLLAPSAVQGQEEGAQGRKLLS